MVKLGPAGMITLLLLTPIWGIPWSAASDGALHLAAREEIGLSGQIQARDTQGALWTQDIGETTSLELSAESMIATLTFRRGVVVGHPDADPLAEYRSEDGRTSETFRGEVNVTVASPHGPGEALAFDGGRTTNLQTSGTGHSPAQALGETYIVRAGDSPDAENQGDGEQVSFWYQPPRPWVSLSGADQGTVTGNFSLFVNNVTVSIQQDGQEVWRNWTGYRQENPDHPVTRYEERILILEVTDGRLEIQGDDSVRLLGPSIDVETVGAVTSDRVEGQLTSQAGTFLFDREPMTLEGRGQLTLSAPAPGQPDAGGLLLSVDPASAFAVRGGQQVTEPSDGVIGGLPLWALLALGGVLLATPPVVGLVKRHGGPLAAWRQRRYTRSMVRGRELASGRDYEAAAHSFRQAVRADPDKGIAWFHLALATLETGDNEGTLSIVDEIRDKQAPVDPLDLLEVETEAARRAGHLDRCRAAIETLADQAPEMARSLVVDLEMDRDELGPELAGRLKPQDEPGGLPGYV